jgi:hypothetical protein
MRVRDREAMASYEPIDVVIDAAQSGGRTPESGYGQRILSRVKREVERPDLSKILTGAQPHPTPHPAARYGQGIDLRVSDFDRPAKWRGIQRLHEIRLSICREPRRM